MKKEHRDIIKKIHGVYECGLNGTNKEQAPNQNPRNPSFEGDAQPKDQIREKETEGGESYAEDLTNIIIKKKSRIPQEKFAKTSEVYKCASDFLDKSPTITWSEHTKLLKELKTKMYQEISGMLSRKQEEMRSKHQQWQDGNGTTDSNTKIRNTGSYTDKLSYINERITELRNVLKGERNDTTSNYLVRKGLWKLIGKRNRLEKRFLEYKKRKKISRLYNKDPHSALGVVQGETNKKLEASKEAVESYFSDVFKEREILEQDRPKWWSDRDLFKIFSRESKNMLNTIIKPSEVEETSKTLSLDSAPGVDGLAYRHGPFSQNTANFFPTSTTYG